MAELTYPLILFVKLILQLYSLYILILLIFWGKILICYDIEDQLHVSKKFK